MLGAVIARRGQHGPCRDPTRAIPVTWYSWLGSSRPIAHTWIHSAGGGAGTSPDRHDPAVIVPAPQIAILASDQAYMQACLVLARAVSEAGPSGADALELVPGLRAGCVAFPVAGCFVSISAGPARGGAVGTCSRRRAPPERSATLTRVAAFEDQPASRIQRSELDRSDIAIWIVHRLL